MSDAHRAEIRRPGEGRDPSVEALKLDPGLRRGDDRIVIHILFEL